MSSPRSQQSPQVFLLCLASVHLGVHSHSLVRRSPDKLAIAPVDSYLPAAEDDSLSGYEEGSGEPRSQQPGDEASGEEEQEGDQFDLPEYSDEENLVEEVTEPPVEENLVEEEEEGSGEDLEKAGATYEAPGPEIPEGDPANLPDSPPGSKVE